MFQPTNGHRCSSKPTWSSVVAGSNKTGQSDGLEIWRPGRLGSHLVVPPEPSMPTFLVFQSLVFKSDSLKPSGLQHSRLLCPSLSPRFSQIHVHWLDAAICLILCHFLLLPSIFPSIRVFSSESVLRIKWPKYWSFSFSISPSNEYSGLISFRIDWLDVFAVQGTLKSLLGHHSSKASILRHSALWSSSHIHTWLLEKPLYGPLLAKWCLCFLICCLGLS